MSIIPTEISRNSSSSYTSYGGGEVGDESTTLLNDKDTVGRSSSSNNDNGDTPENATTTTLTTTATIISTRTLQSGRKLLYLSHFFNQFSENVWQFCLVLFLAAFSNYQSLILVTSYGLVSFSLVCAFSSTTGQFIDSSTNRLRVAQQFIGSENCVVLIATWLCYILLSKQQQQQNDTGGSAITNDNNNIHADDSTTTATSTTTISTSNEFDGIPTDWQSILLLVGIHLLGAIASILDKGFLVAVERDWIVVMSQQQCSRDDNENDKGGSDTNGINTSTISTVENDILYKHQKQWLSDTNVTMRQIDLSCKIIAPAFAGFFVAIFDPTGGKNEQHGYDLRIATLLVGGLNILALVVEYICTAKIYHDIPDLAMKSVEPKNDISKQNGKEIQQFHNNDMGKAKKSNILKNILLNCTVPYGLRIYFDQSIICWAGFALALLYLNVVLTFGGIMTAYLVWRGMSMEAIGSWRGVSSAAGLAGTFVYHYMMAKRNMGLIQIGMISIIFQFLCLTSCYVSLYVDNRNVSFGMLIAGVCLSRIGLWVFDISVTQLMQEYIPAPIRGLVGGVQQSLNAFFTLLAYAVGLFISDPKYFYIYASTAYGGVGLAAIFYWKWVYSKRMHLLPPNTMTTNGSTTELKP